jgi:hypothetical protein
MIPLQKIDSNNGYEYSVTSIDGELILLLDRKYRMVGTILSSTGLLLQSGSVHNDGDGLISSTTTIRRTLSSTVPSLVSSLILITTTIRRPLSSTTVRHPLSSTVPSLASSYSTTTIDGELILLCRLAYRVNRLYQVGKILSPMVLLLLQSGSVHDNTIAITQLVILYQDKYHTIAVVPSLDRNGEHRVDITHRVGKILSPIVLLLRSESVHSDEYDLISTTITT